jgi:hypothetical protein
MATKQRGKGENWDTRPNPFASTKSVGHAPNLGEISNLGNSLDKVLEQGCAVLVGRTRDGGALVLTVLDGEQRHRTYCSTDDELRAAIDALSFVYEE